MFIDAFAPTQCRYYFPHDLIAVIVPCLCFISSLISGSTLKKRFQNVSQFSMQGRVHFVAIINIYSVRHNKLQVCLQRSRNLVSLV